MRHILRRSGWMVVGLLPVLAAAQAGKLVIPDFGDLAKKATESVDITLDGDMLKTATHLMGAAGGRNSGDTDLSSLVAGQKVISVREKGERVEIHMRQNSEDGGLLIVTEEPKELTIVNIAGKINMDQLRQLQGHLGVPNMQGIVGGATPAATPAPPAPAAPQAAPATAAPAPAQRG